MNKKIKIILLIILFLALGFLRENFFKNINAQIIALSNQSEVSELSFWLSFLNAFSVPALLKIKWGATILFAGIFLLLTIITCRTLFDNKLSLYLPILIYGGVFLISFLSIGMGKIFSSLEASSYYFSRWLMGSAQSPLLPGMICILIYYYITQQKASTQK